MPQLRAIAYIALSFLTGATIFGCSGSDLMDEWEHAKQQGFNDFRNSQLDSSASHYLRAVELARQIDPNNPRLAVTLNELARVYVAKGDYKSAYDAYSDAAASLQPAKQINRRDSELSRARCEATEGLAVSAAHLGQTSCADRFFQMALKTAQDAGIGSKVRDVAFEYANFLRKSGKEDQARALSARNEQELQKVQALPGALAESRYVMDTHRQLAKDAERGGDFVTAEHEFRQAVTQADKVTDQDMSGTAASELAEFYLRQKQPAKAETWFRYALECYQSARSPFIKYRAAKSGLVLSLNQQHKAQAVPVAEQLVAECQAIKSNDQNELADALGLLANTYVQQTRYESARQTFSRLYDLYKEHEPLHDEHCTLAMCYVANIYCLQGYRDKFQHLLDEHVAALSSEPPQFGALPGRLLNDYGEVCLNGGYTEEAPGFLQAARKLLKRDPGSSAELARSERLLKKCRVTMGSP